MKLDLTRTTNYAEELELALEVKEWLKTGPELNDLWYYLSKIPDYLQQPIINTAASMALEDLFEEKRQYFREANCEIFVRDVPEDDQLFFLSAFVQYSATSVQKNIIKEFPSVASLVFPADCNTWAEEYLRKINTILSFSVGVDFFTLKFYADAILHSVPDYPTLNKLKTDLLLLTREIQERYQDNIVITEAEMSHELEVLLQAGFMPKPSLEKLLGQGDSVDKNNLILDLIRVIDVILVFEKDVEKMSDIATQTIEDMLLESLRLAAKPEVSARLELFHRGVYPHKGVSDKFLRFFVQVWTPENLQAGKIASSIQQYFTVLAEAEKPIFATALFGYMRSSNLIDILIHPLHLDYILHAVQKVGSESFLLELSGELGNQIGDQDFLPSFKKLIRELYIITHTIKEPENV